MKQALPAPSRPRRPGSSKRPRIRHPRRALAAALAAAALLGGGCSSPGGDLALRSEATSATLAPDLTAAVYTSINNDPNTADIYLTDLPLERVISDTDSLDGATGSLIHIHMFIVPKAGATPIEATACNMTVRQIVLSGGAAAGMYGGGGFLYPSSKPGKGNLSGSVFDATLKLLRASDNFTDRLISATMRGKFKAVRSDAAARAFAARMESMMAALPAVATEPEPDSPTEDPESPTGDAEPGEPAQPASTSESEAPAASGELE